MKRMIPVLTFLSLVLIGSTAFGQWMFFPPQASQAAGKQLGQAATMPYGGASPAASPVTGAVPTAPPPAPTDAGWDQSGIIGRQDRDAAWRHEENMAGINAYWNGVRDGINALHPWGPYPPIAPIGPVFKGGSAGKAGKAPVDHGDWRKP